LVYVDTFQIDIINKPRKEAELEFALIEEFSRRAVLFNFSLKAAFALTVFLALTVFWHVAVRV